MHLNENASPAEAVTVPERLQKVRFISFLSYEHRLVGLARDGMVWLWSSYNGFHVIQKIVGLYSKIVQVVCQNDKASFLTKDVEVWFATFPDFATGTYIEMEAIFGVEWEDTIIQLALTQFGCVFFLMNTKKLIVLSSIYFTLVGNPFDLLGVVMLDLQSLQKRETYYMANLRWKQIQYHGMDFA
ncbi:unnamed protein product [Rhizopus stolonifer]